MEYETREICYLFEGGISSLEIPYSSIEETRLRNTNPAQTEHSSLIEAIKAE
ncbi:MAG: hypothetical protein Q8N63_06020 [Nanoarchaeota archaeon]|nr:hypothetical protein [Nanoarchaeota archaeon]